MKRYTSLLPNLLGLGKAITSGTARDLRSDCIAAVAALEAPPLVFGAGNIPGAGGFLLAANHWHGGGHWVGFTAAALAVPIYERRWSATSIHWIATDRWKVRAGHSELHLPFSETLFRRVARAWSLIPVETGRPGPVSTAGVRRLIRTVDAGNVAGLFPEGEWARAGSPGKTAAGAEHLARLLGRRGYPTLPAAFAGIDGRYYVKFGDPFLAGQPDGVTLAAALRHEFDALLRAAQ